MKGILLDYYGLFLNEYKYPPIDFSEYIVYPDPLSAVHALWKGGVDILAIPHEGLPGYDFKDLASRMVKNKVLEKEPIFEYY